MEKAQVALKLLLDATGVGPDISTVARRKAVQKCVYLVQCAGIRLGYHYNWYVKGPYSPALTRDYYALAERLGTPLDDSDQYSLNDAQKEKIDAIRPLLKAPEGVDLDAPEWLELLASLHFLLTQRKQSREEARDTLAREKAHVVRYADDALEALQEARLTDVAL